MNDLTPDPVDVRAPVRAIGWSPMRGFIDELSELTEARLEGELVLDVTDGREPVVEAVEGDCPLSIAVRVDREVSELRRVVARLVDRVAPLERRVDVLEDRAAGLDMGLAVEVAALKTRVRRLEGEP